MGATTGGGQPSGGGVERVESTSFKTTDTTSPAVSNQSYDSMKESSKGKPFGSSDSPDRDTEKANDTLNQGVKDTPALFNKESIEKPAAPDKGEINCDPKAADAKDNTALAQKDAKQDANNDARHRDTSDARSRSRDAGDSSQRADSAEPNRDARRENELAHSRARQESKPEPGGGCAG